MLKSLNPGGCKSLGFRSVVLATALACSLTPKASAFRIPQPLSPSAPAGRSTSSLRAPQPLGSLARRTLSPSSTQPPRSSGSRLLTLQASETGNKGLQYAVFGGGCFWCTEAVFRRAEGVTNVVNGYAGGSTKNPTYRQVVGGKTGHAEVIQVEFDPSIISLAQLYDLHMASHDPTQVNRQGADVGTQYRSCILYADEDQKQEAERAIERAQEEKNSEKLFGLLPMKFKVATTLEPLDTFYPAENYHQDYFAENPNVPYSLVNIAPKLASYKVRSKLTEIKESAESYG